MKYLYEFSMDFGRMGSLDGLFVSTEEEVSDAINTDVYFGEVLGKHSEVYGVLRDEDISKVPITSEAVEEVSKHLGDTWSGFNPMNYLQVTCMECGETHGIEDWSCEYSEKFDKVVCYECLEELINEEEDN